MMMSQHVIATLSGVSKTMHDVRHDILLDKYKNIVPASQAQRLFAKANQLIIDMSPWGGNDYLKDRLTLLRNAVEQEKLVEFSYTDSSMSPSTREAEPYSLVLKGQSWYLYAYCLLRDEPHFSGFQESRI